jgi:hypothetical protein
MARALCLVAVFLLASAAAAQAPLEAGVKAAYIYRFLEYVTWPAAAFRAPEDPILIGVVQNDTVSAELARIVNERMAQGRKLVLVQLKDERDLPVHVLYIPKLDLPRPARIFEAARQQPTLVITDDPDGSDKGAAITFVPSGGRIQFEVALEAAARAGLNISSRLLAVAVRVKKGEYRAPRYAHAGAVR